ncbi:VPLPA-CTERM protein sorting domain-containing protein [Cognatiyoonia sediminum]|uniref:VPLPA-CTERM protein sorting domain-containing protein n=1 Tax=Cognatiyoonia sediminum TaxID=1508389 RepID=A0A1M5MKK0_9RHOB|nr:hypothetical protein [Cognatiyoonia sediminum]SHG77781.1 VPLPA-CTERM protein sorting domain-containing protein [Cognatiyoonia sediminum]
MKGKRFTLIISALIGFLAMVASGPLSAATFALTEDIQLENVSAARSIETRNIYQINFTARTPRFLSPLEVLENAKDEPEKLLEIKHWLATERKVIFRLLQRNGRFTDVDDPRIRWYRTKTSETEIGFRPEETSTSEVSFPTGNALSWPDLEDGEEKTSNLTTFVVREQDSTCGFPNDFYNVALSSSEQGGLAWLRTATFQPAAPSQPRTPKISGVTWLNMSMPHVVGYAMGGEDHSSVPESQRLSFGATTNSEDSTISGFKQPRDIFRCRVYASDETASFNPPDFTSPFIRAAFPTFRTSSAPNSPEAVPLPAGAALLLSALLGLFVFRKTPRSA